MTKYKIIEELKNIMKLKPNIKKEDFDYIKKLKKMTKKELIIEYESRYINTYGESP